MPLTNEQLLLFQFGAWQPLFSRHSIKGVEIQLPPEAVRYFLDDRVFVSDDNAAIPVPAPLDERYLTEDDYRRTDWSSQPTPSVTTASDSGSDQDGDESDEDDEEPTVHFPDLEGAIKEAISQLGGRVIPKTNFSCPMDASWITSTNTVRCENPDEVLLLLKSSDRSAVDLSGEVFSCCEPSTAPPAFRPTLVLKPYYDLRPEREFRCFVKSRSLLGISQRDMQQHYPQLESERSSIRSSLIRFITEHVLGVFPVPDFSVDVYVTPTGTVKILDFNPWRGYGSTLLFDSWEELEAILTPTPESDSDQVEGVDTSVPELRLTPKEAAMAPGKKIMYGIPYDLVGGEKDVGDMLRELQMQHRQDAYS